MSLQVWLPLNGTLENKGLSNISITNNGAVVDNNGKLGKCYSFNSTNIVVTDPDLTKYKNSVSIATWVKLSATHNNWAQILVLGTYGTNWNDIKCGIDINPAGIPYFSISNGSSYNSLSSGISIKDDNWHHLTGTYDGVLMKLYVDGELKNTITSAYTPNLSSSTIYVGGNSGGEKLVDGGLMNDVRIYDYCLSPTDVKKISKGLILHYKFDDPYLESTTNIDPRRETGPIFNWMTLKEKTVKDGRECWHYILSGSTSDWFGCYDSVLGFVADEILTRSCWLYIPSGQNTSYWYGLPFAFENAAEILSKKVYDFDHLDTWQYCYCTAKARGTNTNYLIYMIAGSNGSFRIEFYMADVQLEEKDHATPYVLNSRTTATVSDYSGYENNGTINGNLSVTNTDNIKYDYNTILDGSTYLNVSNIPNNIKTVSFWVHYDSSFITSSDGADLYFSHLPSRLACGSWGTNKFCIYRSNNDNLPSSVVVTDKIKLNAWNHIVVQNTNPGTNSGIGYLYINGVQIDGLYNDHWGANNSSDLFIGCLDSNAHYKFKGRISDFRIYTELLSADDIKELYNTAGYITNNNNSNTYKYSETLGNINIWNKVQEALYKKEFVNGLSSYTQANCQCTLTDEGYRIYRTPNVTYNSSDSTTQTMWGGLVIMNVDTWFSTQNRFSLTKGHTYVIEFDVKGKTSNPVQDICWSNAVGWGGGGLTPYPSDVQIVNPVTANYNNSTWKHFSYKFTINDDVIKTCTNAYWNYTAGQQYTSYSGFKYGFTYTSTGEMGTDLYINNIQMYDITNGQVNQVELGKNGVMVCNQVIENGETCFMGPYGSMNANQIIEI